MDDARHVAESNSSTHSPNSAIPCELGCGSQQVPSFILSKGGDCNCVPESSRPMDQINNDTVLAFVLMREKDNK